MRKVILFLALVAFVMTSCQTIVPIPPGFQAKVLTPSGFEDDVRGPGQVDIGKQTAQGVGNQLVMLESTAMTVKEPFTQKINSETGEKEDHRLRTSDGTPLNGDIYVQIGVPTDKTVLDDVFTSITPIMTAGNDRVYLVSIVDIYKQYAQMTVRGKVREIFAGYKSAEDVMSNIEKINGQITLASHEIFANSGAPVLLMSVSISNIKEDDEILASKNALIAAQNEAQSIALIGKAMRENPQYLEKYKWDVISGFSDQTGNTLILSEGGNQPVVTRPIR
jgi:hypothetical protein